MSHHGPYCMWAVRKASSLLNIPRTGRVTLMALGSQSEETLLCIREQSLFRGASQSDVRRRWMNWCNMWPSHLQISFLSMAILALGNARSRREPNLCCRGLTVLGDVMLCQKKERNSVHNSYRMGRRIVVMKLICSLGHCECDGHTVHKLSQWRLTADWLDQRESDCLRMNSNVFSDRLPSYIKSNWPVLEIFKVVEYFSDSPRMYNCRIICKGSGLSALTYRVFPDDSWLSLGWCLCPEGTAVHRSACRRIRYKSRRHVSKPLHRGAPLQRLQPAASERMPHLPVVILCKAVVYSVGVSRTEAANGAHCLSPETRRVNLQHYGMKIDREKF
jgi:hypothetical protein